MGQCVDFIVNIATVIGGCAAVAAVLVAWKQLTQANWGIRRGHSPILLIETIEPFVVLNRSYPNIVESIWFKLRNDGNGPALKMDVKVLQGDIQLERISHPSWSQRNIPLTELHRNIVSKGGELECFFKAPAGFKPFEEKKPLLIQITCENIFRKQGSFLYEVPLNQIPAITRGIKAIDFEEMTGFD